MRGRRALLTGVMAAAACLAGPGVAQADHHAMKIVEVFTGFNDGSGDEYVQLQMVASGQNVFAGNGVMLRLWDSSGATHTKALETNPPSGQSGRSVLIGTAGPDVFGVPPDFTFTTEEDRIQREAGAACFFSDVFENIDCVSWGAFEDFDDLTSATGGNLPEPTGFTIGRRQPACGPGPVDTNRPADWTEVIPAPKNNSAAPAPFDPCPQTTITKKPKKKTTKRRAKFKFTATQGVTSFRCKLDDGPFRNCSSPFRKNVGIGKHSFKVKATGDPSPASYSWKRIRG